MAIYCLPSQVPELKRIPKEMQDEIVEAALNSIPISSWHLFTFAAVMFPVCATCLFLAITFGPSVWINYLFFLVGVPVVWIWWLNVARRRIRELVDDVLRQHAPADDMK
jgi:Flp pilus assembly protein TadB